MVVGGQKTKTIHSVLLAFKNAVVQKYDDKTLNILKLYGHSRINLFFQLKMFDREQMPKKRPRREVKVFYNIITVRYV